MADQLADGTASPGGGFLSGGGAMGALMRCHDWAATPLGEPGAWPQSLRSAVSIMLNSRYPIALYWGADLALLYNDAWRPIPGGKHPWALGRPGREVWPEIWATIGPLYDRVLATGEGVWQEDELLPMLRHGYLEECYFNFTFSPVRGEQGTIDGIFNAVVETTDRVLSERRLRTLSRMGARSDPALSAEGACAWAAGILAENRADVPFAQVYLREGDEIRLVASGAVAEPGAGTWPFGEAEAAARAIVIPAPPGCGLVSPFWSEPVAEVVVVPIATAGDERPAAFLVAGANPRRRVDATYRSFFELAAGHVGTALAAARAYEDERRRARALAEIDRAKTAFFSNVSHEFRTPLTLMLGPLEDALAAAEAPEQQVRLGMAHRNALRLLRLVNSLLDFSRIEAGRAEATFRPTDLSALTADLASGFRAATDRAGLRLVVDAPMLSQPVHVDRAMWETIVLNLVSNAFKFTHAGEIAVAVRERDGAAIVTVRDTGTGIPAHELPRLFDRFHRVEGAGGRSFEGSGIGLALVQELVHLHGGTIAVESEERRGSTFTVTIPLGTRHLPSDRIRSADDFGVSAGRAQAFVEEALRWLPEDAADAVLPNGAGIAPPAGGDGGRVLLVDDNADLRDYIVRLLTAAGYEVATAPDGEAALEMLAGDRPDLLVSDVMMPRLDGIGLLRRVRNDAALRDLPVLLLSARAGEEARVDGLEAGADDYLTKPFSARELVARVSANIKLAHLRRDAAEAVRASERRLRELNESLERQVAERTRDRDRLWRLSRDPLLVADGEGRWLAASPVWSELLGWPESDLLGRSSEWMQHPDDHEKTRAALAALAAGELLLRFENRFRASDGTYRWFSWTAVPDDGLIYAVARDVTGDKVRQAELETAQEALRQAQKMEAMGQLTGGVAHDFNNLLTPIVGALDLLQRRGTGGSREQRLVAGAMQSAERAKTLVQRLLAFARRQPLQAMPVDLGALVRGMADLIASTTGPQIRVAVEIAPGLPAAKADPNQLEMALLNLAVNARDAMPDGGTLRISAGEEAIGPDHRAKLPDGAYLRLSVADTGIGMDAAVLARAVEPFFSTKGIGKGTGLGLSMVHGLASQLGGALTIQSRRGVGTNVELWLPVSREPATIAGAPAGLPPEAVAAGVALLVDDEELVRASTADMLEGLGYAVVEAASAEDALRLLEEGIQPTLLVTDHLMPGMSGTDLARRMRSDRPDLQVLLVSGYADTDGIAPDLPRLVKPFRHDELAASLAGLRPPSGR